MPKLVLVITRCGVSEVDGWQTMKGESDFSAVRLLPVCLQFGPHCGTTVVYAIIKSRYVTDNISLITRDRGDSGIGPQLSARVESYGMTRSPIRRYDRPGDQLYVLGIHRQPTPYNTRTVCLAVPVSVVLCLLWPYCFTSVNNNMSFYSLFDKSQRNESVSE